jgi:hypothetical protein
MRIITAILVAGQKSTTVIRCRRAFACCAASGRSCPVRHQSHRLQGVRCPRNAISGERRVRDDGGGEAAGPADDCELPFAKRLKGAMLA